MTYPKSRVDAIVIGGGFYGAAIAIYLVKERGFSNVHIIEREAELLSRASYNNQARVHNGYHYPRSFTTAYRSRVNFPKFINEFSDFVKKDFTKLYAIAKRNSKVTSVQFVNFCKQIGAKTELVDNSIINLFDSRLIEDVFLVNEYAFDSTKLAFWAREEMTECGVNIHLKSRVLGISNDLDHLKVSIEGPDGNENEIIGNYVFNCTYSGLNQIKGDFLGTSITLKHELTEMALLEMPSQLKKLGITLMDGPFFSAMPFPARELHTLSHVRYTPHLSWIDKCGEDPYRILDEYDRVSRSDRMIRDASRYLPAILDATYISSLFEVKTVLNKNELDDGRPILFERHKELPGCYSVLGGKIDNIYDVLEKLNSEVFKD